MSRKESIITARVIVDNVYQVFNFGIMCRAITLHKVIFEQIRNFVAQRHCYNREYNGEDEAVRPFPVYDNDQQDNI